MATLALPTGSLNEPTLRLFRAAGLPVHRSSPRALRARIDFRGLDRVVFCKSREIPPLVADGTFDFGIAGGDWVEETGAKVEVVQEFSYSRTTEDGWRLVLAVPLDHPARTSADLPPGTRVATEYPSIARRHFRALGLDVTVLHSHGSTEGKVPLLADAVLDIVETGASLRHNDLRELETVRHCAVQLVADTQAWADRATRSVIERVATLLRAAHAATEHVLLTVVVPAERWAAVRGLMPPHSWRLTGEDTGTVVAQAACGLAPVAETITALTEAGAVRIVETPVGKLVTP